MNRRIFIAFGYSLLLMCSINICGCNNVNVDTVYQEISEAGKATIEVVKTRPFKHNLQEEGFPNYLAVGRSRGPDYLTESLQDELTAIEEPIKSKFTEYEMTIDGYETYYFEPENYERVIFYIHGGAYFKNITNSHIVTCYNMSQKFNAKVYIPIYPIAPKNDFNDCFLYINQLYNKIVETENDKDIIFAGDSAGGGLALSYSQFLYNNKRDGKLPVARILFSPWVDVTMTNPNIPSKDPVDIFLAPYGLREVGKIWAGTYDTTDYKISPLYGEFEDKIPTIIFHGSDEILFPDAKIVAEKLTKAGTRTRLVIGKGLFHVYSIFHNLPEAQESINMAYDFIVNKK